MQIIVYDFIFLTKSFYMQDFISELIHLYQENANSENAKKQEQYMKNHFIFFGITSPDRKKLQSPFLVKQYLPSKKDAFAISEKLWKKPQRELHYFAIELLYKYEKKVKITDIELFEYLITHNSWWDTVDAIASNLVGNYFIYFPEQQEKIISKWINSNNIWLQRTCLIFQIKYKENTDTELLTKNIEILLDSKEFFINKAIGWTLRQYSRTNPNWVIDFVENHPDLANLSKREALRLM